MINYIKVCKGCKEQFIVNKWQKGKLYCNDACKPTFRPNRGKPRGRPKIDLPTYKEMVAKMSGSI